MAGHLFRQEAIDHQRERLWGEVIRLHNPGLKSLTVLLLLLATTAAGFLVTGEYTRKATVTGMLVTDRGAVQVRAPADGILEVLAVGQGSRVGKGDVLFAVRSDNQAFAGQAVTSLLLAENRRQTALVDKQMHDSKTASALKLQQLAADLGSYHSRQQQLLGLIVSAQAIHALLERQVVRAQALQRSGHIAEAEVEQRRMDLLQQESRLRQLHLEAADNDRALQRASDEQALLDLEHHSALAEFGRVRSQLQQEAVRLQASRGLEIVSPLTGTVAVIYRQQGQAVSTQQPLVTLIPDDSRLEAELFVPTRSAGFLTEHLPVNLRLDAFPYQKFGVARGEITDISDTVLMPADTQGEVALSEPFYKVTAALDRQAMKAYRQEITLRPGMQLQAEILLDSRSLLEWLFEPLFIRGRG